MRLQAKALACVVVGWAAPALAATLQVSAAGEPTTLGAALAAARPGDVIEVAAGRYRENLVIDKPVTLVGRGEPEIVGLGKGDVVLVTADGVTIRGFAVSGSGNRMISSDAGVKIAGARAHVADCRLYDNLFGVYLKGAREALVERNAITGRAEVEVGRRGAGIHFFDAHENTVRYNTVSYVRDGVYFDHSDHNLVADNEFSRLRYGVHYMYCDDNRFYRNVFRDSVAGVAIMYTSRVRFTDNQILNNREGYHAFGLLLKDAIDSVAERNAIVNNVSGIFLDSSHRNVFRANLVAYNDVGVKLYASSLDNAFAANDFIGNQATLHTVGRARAAWGGEGEGNHFSDYAGYDLDGDGRGDLPHRLQDPFEVLEGNHPLLRLFLMSAAARALATAEQAFPLVPGSEQLDAAPAMKPASGVRVTGQGAAVTHGSVAAAGFSLLVVLTAAVAWRLRR